MTEDLSNLRTASLHISRILDESGLNKVTVRKRRDTVLFIEQLFNVENRLTGKEITEYHFGSQTEGATTPGLQSDLDTLYCYYGANVIENWSDWQLGKLNLLMLQDRTGPGYCRLQVLRGDVPVASEEMPDDGFTCYSDGRLIMKHTYLNTPAPGHARNGPAISVPGEPGYADRDAVSALHCKSWPTQAEEFIRRHRRHGWPSQNLLQEAVKHGVFLVPVGYKLSPTEHLEWRISASLTERYLMFDLNTVHIKCYVLLKMLVKTFIEPRARKCISSYHCKTAILHSVENTVPAFWREDNLLKCVTHCLILLLTWVTDGFCPHFVILESNLFAGKVTAQNRTLLQSILKDLITRYIHAFLHVHIDDLGRKLQGKLYTEPSVVPVLDSPATMRLIAQFEYNRHSTQTRFIMKHIILKKKTTHLVSVIRSVYRNIVMCTGLIRHSEKHERQATAVIIENLSRWLGSLLASFSLVHGMRVPCMAIQLLRIGVEYDVASILKLASVFYSNGDFRKVENILSEVENHVSSNIIRSVCGCYHKPVFVTLELVQNLFLQRGSRKRSKLSSRCVIFSSHEIQCTPPGLRNEFFRSIGDDLQHRNPSQDPWMDLAAVDCLPLLYYLQYMVYKQLGKLDLQRQSLHNLDHCLRDDHNFGHLETGWNLLGQCKELEQEPEAAMTCYRTSLETRPRNNAANWLVAILCYKVIKPHL